VTTYPAYVKVVVDPKTKVPGIYNLVIDADARFCAEAQR
jgi:hypothetical protein